MTLEQLERDVAELRQVLAALQTQVSQLQGGKKPRRGVLSIVGSMTDLPGFEDMVA